MGLKFYADTHIAKQITLQLRSNGVDIVRCEEVDMAEADDEAHLIYATTHNRTLITFDKGFRDRAFQWLAEKRNHAGVILIKDYLQGSSGIGTIVTECLFFHEAVEEGAANLDEFHNQVVEIG